MNKETPILILDKKQKQQFRPYSLKDDPHPGQDAIGWRISLAED